MTPGGDELLARTTLLVRRGPYALGSWPRAQDSAVFTGVVRTSDDVCAVMRDDRETTALVRESSLPTLPAPRRVERGFALVTLDLPMEWDVVGVLASLTAALADARIPVGALSAFARDHLLVPASRLEAAVDVLRPRSADVRWQA